MKTLFAIAALPIVLAAVLAAHLAPPKEARILFVGDMLFDRYIRQVIERQGDDFVFDCIDGLLEGADMAVGNLEGPITAEPSVSLGSVVGSPENFRFTFPPKTAELLARHGFGAVNLGNNHIGNFGLEGITSTKHHLSSAGVGYFGGLFGDEPVYRAEVGGLPLSFVSYNEFGGAPAAAVVQTIEAERAQGREVVVYAHWGEEYVEPPPRVRATAEILSSAGATLIVGSHSHVVLSSEYLGETLVYWSLGNFIFDQYWNDEVSRGLAVLATFTQDGLTIQEYPVSLGGDGRTCLLVE